MAADSEDASQSNSNVSEEQQGPSTSTGAGGGDAPADALYECNICLDTAHDAVISMCGHLFCWPCLHQWMETRPNRTVCPVCKSGISKEKVIPLYGRGGSKADPRDKPLPPRPQGQRTEAPASSPFGGINWGGGAFGGVGAHGGGFQLSFGIGAFPFSFFTSTFNFGGGDDRPAAPQQGSRQFEEEQMLSKLFLYVGIIFIVWLLIA